MEEVLSPVDILSLSSHKFSEHYWPNVFVPSHEYLNIGVEKSQYTTFVPKNPC